MTEGFGIDKEYQASFNSGRYDQDKLWRCRIQNRIDGLKKQLVLTKPFSSENGEIRYAIIELEGLLK